MFVGVCLSNRDSPPRLGACTLTHMWMLSDLISVGSAEQESHTDAP